MSHSCCGRLSPKLEQPASSSAAVVSGTVIGVACVVSIWNYLRVVGFSSDGGWLVDGAQLMKLVIPFDMAAAVVAVTVLFLGIRHSADDAGQ